MTEGHLDEDELHQDRLTAAIRRGFWGDGKGDTGGESTGDFASEAEALAMFGLKEE